MSEELVIPYEGYELVTRTYADGAWPHYVAAGFYDDGRGPKVVRGNSRGIKFAVKFKSGGWVLLENVGEEYEVIDGSETFVPGD